MTVFGQEVLTLSLGLLLGLLLILSTKRRGSVVYGKIRKK
jgi:hypothetical protein